MKAISCGLMGTAVGLASIGLACGGGDAPGASGDQAVQAGGRVPSASILRVHDTMRGSVSDNQAFFVASTAEGGPSKVFHLDMSTGKVEPLAIGKSGADVVSAASFEGKAYFKDRDDGREVLRIVDVTTRTERSIPAPQGSRALATGPDGVYIHSQPDAQHEMFSRVDAEDRVTGVATLDAAFIEDSTTGSSYIVRREAIYALRAKAGADDARARDLIRIDLASKQVTVLDTGTLMALQVDARGAIHYGAMPDPNTLELHKLTTDAATLVTRVRLGGEPLSEGPVVAGGKMLWIGRAGDGHGHDTDTLRAVPLEGAGSMRAEIQFPNIALGTSILGVGTADLLVMRCITNDGLCDLSIENP